MANESWLPSKYQSQVDELKSRQQLAQSMLKSIQAPQAQMVGGRYVSPGILGGMMPLIQAMVGSKLSEKQTKEMGELTSQFGNAGALGSPAALMKNRNVEVTDPMKYAETGDPRLVKQRPQFDPRTGLQGTDEFITLDDGTYVQVMEDRNLNKSYRPVKSGTTINMPGTEKSFEAKLGGGQADLIKEGYEKANTAKTVLNGVQNARNIIEQSGKDLVTGSFSNPEMLIRGVASKYFGIGDADEVANTQELVAQMVKQVPGLVKELGGTQISNTDLETALRTAGADPNLQLEVVINILNRMEAESLNAIDKYQGEFERLSAGYPDTQQLEVYRIPRFEYDETGMGRDMLGQRTPRRYKAVKPPEAPPPPPVPKDIQEIDAELEKLLNKRVN